MNCLDKSAKYTTRTLLVSGGLIIALIAIILLSVGVRARIHNNVVTADNRESVIAASANRENVFPPSPLKADHTSPQKENYKDPDINQSTDAAMLVHESFENIREAAEANALKEIRDIIRNQGAVAAVDFIRATLSGAKIDLYDRLKDIYLARLLPFAAGNDSAAKQSALMFVKEILSNSQSGEWVRFQILAGLAGIKSTEVMTDSDTDGSNFNFVFRLEDRRRPNPHFKTEYESSFADILQDDPYVAKSVLDSIRSDQSSRVRSAAARVLGTLSNVNSADILINTCIADTSDHVRREAMESLVKLQVPNISSIVQGIAGNNEYNKYLRSTALRLLPETASIDNRDVIGFLATAAISPNFSDVRPALAEATFELIKRTGAIELDGSLITLLTVGSNDGDMVKIFVKNSVEAGRIDFVPIYRAIIENTTDRKAKESLTKGINQLENLPLYKLRAANIQESTDLVQKLWRELESPNVGRSRRSEIIAQMRQVMRNIKQLKSENE